VSAPDVCIVEDGTAWAESAAKEVAARLNDAVARRAKATLVLAGGETPRSVYQRLAEPPFREQVDWPKVEIFWGDERCVSPHHPASNYAMVKEALLSRLAATGPVHRIRGEAGPARAARDYAAEIRPATGADAPRFDLVLLGLGSDGHTASLFPDTPGLRDERRLVVATTSPSPPHERVSLTLRAINAARNVIFLVAGRQKAAVLADVLAGGHRAGPPMPAALVRPREGRLLFIVDGAAAAELETAKEAATRAG
jgi:6-phosphogluconolactonase